MPCFHLVTAWKTPGGSISFDADPARRPRRSKKLQLPCGQCWGCKLERSRQWAMRCMHEASLYDSNCFLTLTVDDAHLPARPSLDHGMFKDFLRRLTYFYQRPVRYYMCGEYMEKGDRPHFHALLFDFDFPDKALVRQLDAKCDVYRSPRLEKLWTHGWSSIGAVTFESAAYVARYCLKKISGERATEHYARIDAQGTYSIRPEYACMSRRPGIGKPWLDKFMTDVYPVDYVIVNGRECRPPRSYDKLFEAKDLSEFEAMKARRELRAHAGKPDNTKARLAVREEISKSRHKFKIKERL